MSNSKNLGQVFTPDHIVKFMLDNVGYTSAADILDKTIYEPSFGKGVFLHEIVKRQIEAALGEGITPDNIAQHLNDNVHGVEYDPNLHRETLTALSSYVEKRGIPTPAWDNLIHGDALGYSPANKFDFVVGNPPYIRTHNLTPEMRANVERFPLSSVGTPDLYVTFLEYGLSVLSPEGKLAYIMPNSWLKNTSQKALREYLFDAGLVESIYDFMSEKVFSNIGTYTAIVTLSAQNTTVEYSQKENGNWVTSKILYDDLQKKWNALVPDGTWLFQSPRNQKLLRENRSRPKKFGDICVIQNALMTMRNGIYLAAANAEVEEDVLYDAVKASTYRGGPTTEKILFPYKVSEDGVAPYSEDEFSAAYPKAYGYLTANREELLARKRDASAEWFHYGRSQGIALLPRKRKIVFRQHLSESQTTMDVHILPESTLVYGGWFIMEKEGSGYSLEDIKKIMESEEFCTIMRLTGKDMSGGYKELYSKHLKAFGIE